MIGKAPPSGSPRSSVSGASEVRPVDGGFIIVVSVGSRLEPVVPPLMLLLHDLVLERPWLWITCK